MRWYENTAGNLIPGRSYSHQDLITELRKEKTGLSASTYHWAISGMIRNGTLQRKGYDVYVLSDGKKLHEYRPVYSDIADGLIHIISEKFPYVSFTVFETILMNDFLNHLIAQNTVFIQAEKEISIFVFRFLQDAGLRNLMYKPQKKDFTLYWTKDCIVVTDLISEAPMKTENPHEIMLEKMLVDICADKLIASTYNKSDLPDVFETAEKQFRLDKARLLRYARRRSKENEIKKYLEKENGK